MNTDELSQIRRIVLFVFPGTLAVIVSALILHFYIRMEELRVEAVADNAPLPAPPNTWTWLAIAILGPFVGGWVLPQLADKIFFRRDAEIVRDEAAHNQQPKQVPK